MFKVRATLTEGRTISSQIGGSFTDAMAALSGAMQKNGIDPNAEVVSLSVKRLDAGTAFKIRTKSGDAKGGKSSKKSAK